MKLDIGIEDIRFNREEYDFSYTFTYHEGCDRMEINKKDGSEEYILDIGNFRTNPEEIIIEWGMYRSIRKKDFYEVSPLDPEVWEFIEGCAKEGPMFGNSITGGWASFCKNTGKVKLLSKGHSPVFNPVEQTRRIARVNSDLGGFVNERKKSKNRSKITEAELKARETLRDIITESDWRRYITNGYLLINGVSGRVYQVFANHAGRHIKVYEKGECKFELCIHSEGVPDSDHVLNCMMMIQNEEDDFVKQCNKHSHYNSNSGFDGQDGRDPRYRNKSISEIYQMNKRIAEKLVITSDWIDLTKEKAEELKEMQAEIELKTGIMRGMRDIDAGRVIPAEEVLEDLDVDRRPVRLRKPLRADRLDPETEEIINEALYDILGPDFFDEEPRIAVAN